MVNRGSKKKEDNPYALLGGLTPKAFMGKQDTLDGRNTNAAKNLERKAKGK
jgi:hypothetical protein